MSRLITFSILSAVACSSAFAVEPMHDSALPRVVGQLMVGTAGFEPGIAAEWRLGDPQFMVRPEVFRNTDDRMGGAASLGMDLGFLNLPDRQAISVGPRIVYHNSDEFGWEADAMVIWHVDFIPAQRGRHFLELIGTAGVLQDDDQGDKTTRMGASAGIAYGFQF